MTPMAPENDVIVDISADLDQFIGSFEPKVLHTQQLTASHSTWTRQGNPTDQQQADDRYKLTDMVDSVLSRDRAGALLSATQGKTYYSPLLAARASFTTWSGLRGEVWIPKDHTKRCVRDLNFILTDKNFNSSHKFWEEYLTEEQAEAICAGASMTFVDAAGKTLITQRMDDCLFFRPFDHIDSAVQSDVSPIFALHCAELTGFHVDPYENSKTLSGTHRWLQATSNPTVEE